MSKYKLIKEYPGSPKLGSVYKELENTKNMFVHEYEVNKPYLPLIYFKNSEFWKEIIEKEWEILEVRGYSGDYVVQKDGSFYFMGELYGNKSSGVDAFNYLNSKFEHHIHSIRRLSDDMVFSVGDKVFETVTGKKDNWIIKEFSLKDSRCFSCGININNFEHYKEPLFLTEDKVEIFNGDNYWFIVESGLEILKPWTPRLHICDWDYSGEYKKPPLGHKQFSTRKAAEDYIKSKKPLFITEDSVEVFEEGDFFIVDTDYDQEGACYFVWHIEKLFIKNKSYLPNSSCVKIFSTKKAAKDWIELNKPKYSLQDIKNACTTRVIQHINVINDIDFKKLK